MLKWIVRNRLAAFEKKFDYDMSYVRHLLATDARAFFAFAKVMKLGEYRRDIPKDVYWAAKLTGTITEDCGPCTQLLVTMALADGVDPAVIRSVFTADAAMPEAVKLGVDFAAATLAHDPAADELRDRIVKRWGERALISLAFAIVSSRIYPTLKYALGHGKACRRVVVAGTPIAVAQAA
ncbi:MAG: hypothetical protein ABI867_42470 [Kofleriaceae bacterium]